MDIQDTIVELFDAKRIDKATAYRLLSEAKQAGAGGRAAAPQQIKTSFTCSAGQSAQQREHAALLAWAYQLHVAMAHSELAFDYVTPQGACRIQLHIDGGATFNALATSLASQLAVAAAGAEPAQFAWLAAGASDTHARLVSATVGSAAQGPGAALTIALSADPSAQGATLVADWPDTIEHLIAQMQQHAATPFAELDLLPARHLRMIKQYNETAGYLPPERTVAALLDPVLRRMDGELAVLTSNGSQTYSDFRQHAYRLAHQLRALGAKPNAPVAVVLHRTKHMPATLYGILCAGAPYVPMETDMPWERVLTILDDAATGILVTDSETLYTNRLELEHSPLRHIVCIDGWPRSSYRGIPVFDKHALAVCSSSAPALVNAPDDLAYILFTSGSTGTPKGVMVSHLNMVNSLIGVNNAFGIGQHDRIFCFSSYGFDLSVWDLFGSILAGASMFVPTRSEIRDPFALMGFLREQGITVWDSTPTGIHQLLLSFKGKNAPPVMDLRLVLLGGEFIHPSLPEDLYKLFPNCRLANLGGATEVTIYSNYYFPVMRWEPHWKSIPYGKPLSNQRMYVLNDSLKPCSIGEKGMIYYGGLSVASGYHGDAAKTAASFIAAPWADEPGGRLYCTGDLGIMHADGQMELCGRVDQQVKVRGFRIELGEIESQLNAIAGIDQSVVVARQDESLQFRVVAFYTSAQGEIGADLLRTRLGARLPEYMIPSQFVHLVDPPIGASGKLDRGALTKRAIDRDAIAPEYSKPKDAMEAKLAEELARILKLDRVGVDDDFFLIGGDSLISLQYMAVLSELGFKSSPIDIQQGRTIRGVLERVSQDKLEAGQLESIDGVIPHGPMARRFFERLPMVDRNHWNQLTVIGFDHRPDVERLEQALQAVFRNHVLLRAAFRGDQMIAEAAPPFALNVIDCQRELLFLRGRRLNQEAQKLHASIGLNGQRLTNAALIVFSPADVRLVWGLHHTVVDGNCWRILIDDLARAYRQPSGRLLRSSTFTDYVMMVRARTAEAVTELGQRPQYARMQVPRRVPFGDPSVTNTEGENRTLFKRFSASETTRLLALVRPGRAANLNLLLLTSLSMAMRSWSGQQTVRFDVISNGRSVDPTRDYSRTIGWFATHNPFEVAVPEQVESVLANVVDSWQHYQDYSRFFVAVGNEVRGDAAHPLGQQVDQALLYSHLGDFDSLDMPIGWTVRGTAGRNRGLANPRTHDLELETMVVHGHLMARLVYGSKLLGRGQAASLLSHLRRAVLQTIAALEQSYQGAPGKGLPQSVSVDLIPEN